MLKYRADSATPCGLCPGRAGESLRPSHILVFLEERVRTLNEEKEVMKVSDILSFFRRLLGLRKPEEKKEEVAREKVEEEEVPEEKEKEQEKKERTPEKGKTQQRKRRQTTKKKGRR